MKTIAEQIEVMQAYERGEKIQCESNRMCSLHSKNTFPILNFNWFDNDYNIVRKPIEGWVWAYPHGTSGREIYSTEAAAKAMYPCASGQPVFMREVTDKELK